MGDASIRLSACLIVKNEQEQIEPCIASFRELVDEIVVVDTGSTDSTPDIASRLGARVVPFEWIDDFAAARNAGLDVAQGRWILVVDADERLAPVDTKRLHERLNRSDQLGLSVAIDSQTDDGAVETALITRLFRNDPRIRYEGRIHESVLGSIVDILGKETWTPPQSGLTLTHDGYLRESRESKNKASRNHRLLELQIHESPDDPGPRFLLARELIERAGGDVLDTPNTRRGFDWLKPAISSLLEQSARGITEPSLDAFARAAIATARLDAAESTLSAWSTHVGQTARWHYAKGELLLASGDRSGAGRHFARVKAAPEGSAALPCPQIVRNEWSTTRAAICSDQAVSVGQTADTILAKATAATRTGVMEAIAALSVGLETHAQDARLWLALAIGFETLQATDRVAQAKACAAKIAPGWAAIDSPDRSCGLIGLFSHDLRNAPQPSPAR